jgi:hypothetical protein
VLQAEKGQVYYYSLLSSVVINNECGRSLSVSQFWQAAPRVAKVTLEAAAKRNKVSDSYRFPADDSKRLDFAFDDDCVLLRSSPAFIYSVEFYRKGMIFLLLKPSRRWKRWRRGRKSAQGSNPRKLAKGFRVVLKLAGESLESRLVSKRHRSRDLCSCWCQFCLHAWYSYHEDAQRGIEATANEERSYGSPSGPRRDEMMSWFHCTLTGDNIWNLTTGVLVRRCIPGAKSRDDL